MAHIKQNDDEKKRIIKSMKYDEFFYVRKTKTIPMQANCPYGMQL